MFGANDKFIVFTLIPLILSIGIIPAIPFSDATENTQICIDKVWLENSKGKIACVTPSTADKLVQRGWGTILSDDAFTETKSETTPFEVPPYPEQPSIHPKLLATNDLWSPPAVHKVTDGVYVAVGFDGGNSIMIEGDDGLIIIDTLASYESAKKVISEFRKITDKPVKAIIYTHGHLDHVHGTGAFLEEGEDIEIYAHESHVDFYINENSVLGPIASQRTAYVTGAFLPEEGPDSRNMGVFPPIIPVTIAYALPTQTFSDELEVEIEGVKIKMVYVAGESTDQIFVWLPEKEVLCVGDNLYAIIPNMYTLRGVVYRDPMNYVNAYDKMLPLDAEYLIASHVKPIIGKENVRDVIISTRDATQYVYDQTIRGMNQGYSADELSRMIQLPENLENHHWLTQSRGQIPWHVKQIYNGNLGWFEGDPAFLNSISIKERAQKIVEGFGGIDDSILLMRDAINNDEYGWAAELGAYILYVEPDNQDLKLLQAHVLRVLAQRSVTMDERHWLLTNALEHEGKITITPGAITQSSPEQMAELPIEKLIRFLPTKLDPQKATGVNTVLGISYSDIDMSFTLHVRNNILAVTDGFPENPDMSITLDSDTHKLLIGGHMTALEGLDSDVIDFDGNRDELRDFFSMFDIVTMATTGTG